MRGGTQRGIALIVVLWAVILLGVIASGFAYEARALTERAGFNAAAAQARSLARAALEFAVVDLLRHPEERMFPPDGTPVEWSFADGQASIRVQDAAGRYDVNHTRRDLLVTLFESAGMDPDEADALTAAMEDWRDADDLPRTNGAEAAEYESAGRDDGPANAPFQSVVELRQVLGMSDAVYRALEPLLTVHSQQPQPRPELMSEDARTLLEGDDGSAPAPAPDNGDSGTAAAPPPVPPTPPGGAAGQARVQEGLAYHVTVVARGPRGGVAGLETIVRAQRARLGFASGLPVVHPLYQLLESREIFVPGGPERAATGAFDDEP